VWTKKDPSQKREVYVSQKKVFVFIFIGTTGGLPHKGRRPVLELVETINPGTLQ